MVHRLTPILAMTSLLLLTLLSGAAQAQTSHAVQLELRQYCCDDWTGNNPTSPSNNPNRGAFFLNPGGTVKKPATVARTLQQTAGGQINLPQSLVGTQYGPIFVPVGLNGAPGVLDSFTATVDITNEPGVFSAGGGPGTFEFCPVGVGPAPGACASPGSATSGTPTALGAAHGRISVTAGLAQYGGAMGFLGAGAPTQLNFKNDANAPTAWTARNLAFPLNGLGDATTASNKLRYIPQTIVSNRFTTSMHNFQTFTNPSSNPAWISVMTVVGRVTNHAWTTGMVTVSITDSLFNNPPFQAVTMTGSDSRTPSGNGQLTLVSGSLYSIFNVSTQVRGQTLVMKVPEPAAAMSLAGGAIALLLIGVRRRA